MFRSPFTHLSLLASATTLLALGAVTPASADNGPCPGATVPAFQSSDVTLAPEPNTNYTIWGNTVSILAFCEDFSKPNDVSHVLPGINVSAITLVNTAMNPEITDLQVSVSKDGSGPFTATPPAVPTTIATSGITTDSSGHATFVMRAQSPTVEPFLGNTDGTPHLIGMHFDLSFPTQSSPALVLPDEGNVFAATPELDSLFLFGSGALGIAGYGLMRVRARRPR